MTPAPRVLTTRGITLFELLIAATISLFMLLVISRVNLSREYHNQRVQNTSIFRVEAGLLLATMAKRLEVADRIVLHRTGQGTDPMTLLFRVPLGTSFDDPANYRWAEYRHVDTTGNTVPDTVLFYNNIGDQATPTDPCVVSEKFFGVSGLTVTFADEVPPPGPEFNALELKASLVDPNTSLAETTFTEEVIFRSRSSGNLDATCAGVPCASCTTLPCDSGSGLARPGVSLPRDPCP